MPYETLTLTSIGENRYFFPRTTSAGRRRFNSVPQGIHSAIQGRLFFSDGKPIDWGAISFIPKAGDEQRVSGGVIKDGQYTVSEEMGANAGIYRVEIRWGKRTGKMIRSPGTDDMIEERKEGLPETFHKNSNLTVEVSSKQKIYDFDLKTE